MLIRASGVTILAVHLQKDRIASSRELFAIPAEEFSESVFINCINIVPEPSEVLAVKIHYEPREMGDFRLIGFNRQRS